MRRSLLSQGGLGRGSVTVDPLTTTAPTFSLSAKRLDHVSLDDLSEGLGPWRNIQDIVRWTVKAVVETARDQSLEMADMRAEMKALKSRSEEMQSRLSALDRGGIASMSDHRQALDDLRLTLSEMRRDLDRKIDRTEAQEHLRTKVDMVDLDSLREDLRRDRHGSSRISQFQEDLSILQSELQHKVDRLQLDSLLSQKVSREEMQQELELKANRQSVVTALQKKVSKSDYDQDLGEIRADLASKADSSALLGVSGGDRRLQRDIEEQLTMVTQELTSKILELARNKADVDSLEQVDCSPAICLLEKSIHELRESKVDRDEMQLALQDIPSAESFRRIINRKADIDFVQEQIATVQRRRKESSAVEQSLSSLTANMQIEDFRQELQKKANLEDMLKLLDVKADVELVDTVLTEMEAKSRGMPGNIQNFFDEQTVINDALCSQNLVARWIWKSGKLKNQHGVPWNVQIVNTNPENFLWQKGRVNIQVVNGGLYEVSFGFYSRKKPTVQLHVNGEAVLSALNTSSYALHHSSGRMTNVGRHPSGCVTGLTMIDFLALPNNAKLAISYSGEELGEGFLGIKKL